MEPPLALHPGDVVAEVVVLVELTPARALFGTRSDLAAVREVGDFADAAVGTRQQIGHGGAILNK
jgi:hypothetical protein